MPAPASPHASLLPCPTYRLRPPPALCCLQLYRHNSNPAAGALEQAPAAPLAVDLSSPYLVSGGAGNAGILWQHFIPGRLQPSNPFLCFLSVRLAPTQQGRTNPFSDTRFAELAAELQVRYSGSVWCCARRGAAVCGGRCRAEPWLRASTVDSQPLPCPSRHRASCPPRPRPRRCPSPARPCAQRRRPASDAAAAAAAAAEILPARRRGRWWRSRCHPPGACTLHALPCCILSWCQHSASHSLHRDSSNSPPTPLPAHIEPACRMSNCLCTAPWLTLHAAAAACLVPPLPPSPFPAARQPPRIKHSHHDKCPPTLGPASRQICTAITASSSPD